MDKLKIGWGLRARRYEERILAESEDSILRNCWREKERYEGKDEYSKEREKYYNRNGWGVGALENIEDIEGKIISRERDVQRQWEGGRITEARYNKKYKEIEVIGEVPRYLRIDTVQKIRLGEGIRALMKLRCGNFEEANKYWLEENQKGCIFCGEELDCIEHYMNNCNKTKGWFEDLGEDERERNRRLWDDNLDICKANVVKKLWREREKELRKRNGRN